MNVIGHQAVRVQKNTIIGASVFQSFKKKIVIGRISEDGSSFVSAGNDVIKGVGIFDS